MTQILIPGNFRDKWFSKNFGNDVQERIQNAGHSIEIDFSDCEWVDPIPMMALICHLQAWANSPSTASGRKLIVDLGRSSTDKVDLRKARARLFLAAHGFLRAIIEVYPSTLLRYDSCLDQFPSHFDASIISQLEGAIGVTANCALLYGKDPVCPPMLLKSGQETGNIASFVDKAVKTMDSKLFSGRQSEFLFRDSALVRVRQVATEIILNASEHAYDVSVEGPICLYARVRCHNDHSPEEEAENTKHCPLIDHIQGVTSGRYIELYICDIGRGLCHHANEWAESASDKNMKTELKEVLANKENSFRKLLSMAFRRPISRHQRGQASGMQTRSNVTGLSHVNRVLISHKDCSRILVSPDWTAGPHPRPPDYHGGPSDGHFASGEPTGISPDGTFFHFAIKIPSKPILDGWLVPQMLGYQPQDAFKNDPNDGASHLPVFDLASLLTKSNDARNLAQKSVGGKFDIHLNEKVGDVAVIRMSRDFRKNLTDELISRWLEHCSAPTLAFCDLSRAEAILLAEHIQSVNHNEKSLYKGALAKRPSKILILSEDLISQILFLDRGERNLLCFKKRGLPEPSLILQIIRSLRHFDSNRFWEQVNERLLLRNVLWSGDGSKSTDIRLPTYLDYPLAVQNRELAKIVRRALRRVLAAFPGHNSIAADELIKPDLADASRWMARPPTKPAPPNLFVISSVVTGLTFEREARYRGDPNAVVACFLVETSPIQPKDESRFAYYSALEWNPPTSSSQCSKSEIQWEREPGTPFVRPFVARIDNNQSSNSLLIKPIARNLVDRGDDDLKPPSAAESYHDWHRDQLLKVGHWSIDRRHGLVEINHLGALQMFADSAKGFYEWLSHELNKRAGGMIKPLLVYPPGRLNAVMVRHLFKLQDPEGLPRLKDWQVEPINFLPDIGDGLKRLTPLTAEHISTYHGAIGGTVFFLDIGYVGNRTFRHTRRQLLDLGVRNVIGFGLLNRTSSPAFEKELNKSDVNCYWRMDVPSLDDERSCPICGSRKAMLALQERVRRFQNGNSSYVQNIFDHWELADPGQTWEDNGLPPIELNIPLLKKFGFIPPETPVSAVIQTKAQLGQQSLLTPDDEFVAPPQAPATMWPSYSVEWRYVWLRDSAQAVTYAIEIARTQASPLYPLRLAKQLAEPEHSTMLDFNGLSAAVEVLSCYLLLCAHELSLTAKEAGGGQLLRYLAKMEGFPVPTEDAIARIRLARLRELAGLALINLDPITKRLLLDEVVSVITKTRMVNPETRVALMAAIIDTTDDGNSTLVGKSRFDNMVMTRLHDPQWNCTDDAGTLRWNYWLLTICEQTIPDQFEAALTFFGAGLQHGDCVKRLGQARSDANQSAGWGLCRSALQNAHTLIFRSSRFNGDSDSPDLEPGELFSALCKLDIECVKQILKLSQQETAAPYNHNVNLAMRLIETARTAFQGAMIRFDPSSPDNSLDKRVQPDNCLDKLVLEVSKQVALAAVENVSNTYQIHTISSEFLLADGARYLLFGDELKLLIERLAKEAFENSGAEELAPPKDFHNCEKSLRAKLWILFLADKNGGVTVEFWNQGKLPCMRPNDFECRAVDMAPVHKQLGTVVCRTAPKGSAEQWYRTKIVFRWIQGGRS